MTPERVGPYRIDDVLGSGGMGEVYRPTTSASTGGWRSRRCSPGGSCSGERRERLLREARAAAALNHPAVAQVHDIVTEGDRSYIVMEYVEGETLAEVIARGPLDLRTALRVGQQVAEGLHAAHQRGIVHRDLKAENIMVTPSGQAKILDFGLAKRLDPSGAQAGLTAEGVVMGTCHAMSPEQAEGLPVDHRSDLFALGTLLYAHGDRRAPVRGGRRARHYAADRGPQPPSPQDLDPAVPPPVSRLILRLLAKEPGSRPTSADEVAWVLRAQAERSDGEATVRTRAVVSGRHLGQLSGRRAVVATGLGLLAIAAGVTLAWRHLAPRPPLVVAVPRPEATGHSGNEGAALAAAAVREALLSSVVGLDGLVAPSPDAVDAVAGTPVEVARAVAADEVLTASVDASGSPCRIVLRRLAGADGRLLWTSGVFEAPAGQLRLMADSVSAQVRRGYAERRPRQGAFVSEASPEDYADYLRVADQLDHPHPGIEVEGLLDRLAGIRRTSPRLLEAYSKEVVHLRYLVATTRRQEYLERGRQVALAAAQLAPKDPRAVLPSIEMAFAAGDLEAAEEAIGRLESIDPADFNLLRYRARLEEDRGRPEQAHALLLRMVEVRPTWQSHALLADLERRRGRYDEARDHLAQAVSLAPRTPYLRSKLAETELAHGSVEHAAQLYRELVAEQRGPVTLCNLGTALMIIGRYEDAAGALREALELAPDDPETLLSLADCESLRGNVSGARQLYQEALAAALDLEGDEVVAVAVTAQCQAHLGDAFQAAAAVDRELRLAPDDPQTLFDAALVYALIGDRSAAVVNARKALEAGFQPRWFELPWFDPIRLTPGFPRGPESAPDRGVGRFSPSHLCGGPGSFRIRGSTPARICPSSFTAMML